MAKAASKTNAMRALDQRKIEYEVFSYDESIHSAVAVAEVLGIPPEQVFKTLVMLPSIGRPILVMVPGDAEVDPRLLARSIDVKGVNMASKRDAERLTGLLVGGIGALALLGKPFDVYLERAAISHSKIFVNGGRRGINLRVAVNDLIRLTSARVVDVAIDTETDRIDRDVVTSRHRIEC